MLFLALSSLQGRPMGDAFDDLAGLGVAIQLTPGNLPTPGFREHVARSGVATRRHHGFAWDARRQDTWSACGACLVTSESVHPPEGGEAPGWMAWYERAAPRPILEVMYPGHALGRGDEVDRAMDAGWPLAVDVSHVYIQRRRSVMDDRVWRRLQGYEHVAEIHVSANAGRHDTHEPSSADTFGLDWARERAADVPLVLECYMHRLSVEARQAQIELARRTP